MFYPGVDAASRRKLQRISWVGSEQKQGAVAWGWLAASRTKSRRKWQKKDYLKDI